MKCPKLVFAVTFGVGVLTLSVLHEQCLQLQEQHQQRTVCLTGSDVPVLAPAPGPERLKALDRQERTAQALVGATLCMLLLATGAYCLGRAASSWEAHRESATLVPNDQVVEHLHQHTQQPGDFVILDHLAEEVDGSLRTVNISAAHVRAQSPDLQHKVIAGRWVLRRPRV